jgi:hypothetical protein
MGLFDLETDIFDEVSSKIEATEDYFDFPSSMIAFGESMPGSSLFYINDKIFFRKRNKQLTLITYFCSSIELMNIIKDLKIDGYSIKGLNYTNKYMDGIPKKKSHKEFFALNGYSAKEYALSLDPKSHTRRDILLAIRKGEETYTVETELYKKEAFDLFNDWAEEAKDRHFMVVKGHYNRYLERYFQYKNNVRMLGFRRKKDGLLYGITGYENFDEMAQATLGKHRIGDRNFARFYLIKLIEIMFTTRWISGNLTKKIFLGSTADYLKLSLNLDWQQSYKFDFDSIGG